MTIGFQAARLQVAIEDDGVGLEDDTSPPMHYGLVIMRDRADTLGGRMTVSNRPQGGTRVELIFTPQTARLIHQQASAEASHVDPRTAITTDSPDDRTPG